MLEYGVRYGQAVTSTEVQQQDTTRVQIRGAVPPNHAPPGWVLHTAVWPVSRNNSETPIPGPKAQGNNPLVYQGKLQHMAAELGGYKQAHTSPTPLTMGNSREEEGPTSLKELGSRAQACMFEVMTSEASYMRSLNVLRDHFLGSRELDNTLVIHDKKSLFSNILQVHEVSQRFLQDLLARVDECVLISDVCDIIYHHAQTHFSVYVEYVRNQVYQEKTYNKLMQCNREFHTVMRRLEQSPLCNRLPFTSFMLLPFQRITRIKILIQSILKNTVEGSKEENKACRALTTMIKEANTQVGQMKQMEELIHITTMREFDKLKAIPLVSRTGFVGEKGGVNYRSSLKEDQCSASASASAPIYIFLFNDIIILTRRRSDLHRWTAAFPSVSMTPELKEEECMLIGTPPQVQCIQQYVAKQADELSLEPSDIINVIRKTSEGWWEGIRLSDQTTGLGFPHTMPVIEVTNEHQRRRNLSRTIPNLSGNQSQHCKHSFTTSSQSQRSKLSFIAAGQSQSTKFSS
ncbi:hypothetical protein QTP70_029058, partial [Hemibagrus guttatus]